MVYQHEIKSHDKINELQTKLKHVESVNYQLHNDIKKLSEQNRNLSSSFVIKYRYASII